MSALRVNDDTPTGSPQPGLMDRIKGKLGSHQVSIGKGLVFASLLVFIVSITMAKIGTDIWDTAHTYNYPQSTVFEMAKAEIATGSTFAAVSGVTLIAGAYLWATGKNEEDQNQEASLMKDRLISYLKKLNRVDALKFGAAVFTILFMIGLTMASGGGHIYDTANSCYPNSPDSQLFDLSKKIWTEGAVFTAVGAVFAVACAAKAYQLHKQSEDKSVLEAQQQL